MQHTDAHLHQSLCVASCVSVALRPREAPQQPNNFVNAQTKKLNSACHAKACSYGGEKVAWLGPKAVEMIPIRDESGKPTFKGFGKPRTPVWKDSELSQLAHLVSEAYVPSISLILQ